LTTSLRARSLVSAARRKACIISSSLAMKDTSCRTPRSSSASFAMACFATGSTVSKVSLAKLSAVASMRAYVLQRVYS
jgi:hypothetical protein